jgi:hypothetical protein
MFDEHVKFAAKHSLLQTNCIFQSVSFKRNIPIQLREIYCGTSHVFAHEHSHGYEHPEERVAQKKIGSMLLKWSSCGNP